MPSANRTPILLLAAVACADPVLDPLGASLEAWQAGVAAMAAGDPAAAQQQFRAARQSDPASPSLCAWEARAAAAGADPASAMSILDACIDPSAPAPVLLRERASAYARSGAIDRAARDLHVLIRLGAETPRSLGADPDLQALAAHPSYPGLVVTAQPILETMLVPKAVLVGERWAIELAASDAPSPLSLGLGAGEGLALEALIEDQPDPSDPSAPWRLTLRGLARGGSAAPVGPLSLALGDGRSAATPAITMARMALGPEGAAASLSTSPTTWPGSVPMPSAARTLAPQGQLGRTGAWLLIGGAPGQAPTVQPPPALSVQLELRSEGQPVYLGLAVPAGSAGEATLGHGPDGQPIRLSLP
jgi:hypothetical protein